MKISSRKGAKAQRPETFVPRRSWALVTDVGLVGHVSDNRDVLEQMRRGGERIQRCQIVPASVDSVPSVVKNPALNNEQRLARQGRIFNHSGTCGKIVTGGRR